MRLRGINNPDELLAFASASVILQTCEWWDCKRGAGPGLLAKAIRDGGVAAPAPAPPPTERPGDYMASIVAWLTEQFPELCDPQPHPGAISAVIRLHLRDGKRSLTVAGDGAAIRAGVKRFDRIGELSPTDEARAERRRRERLGLPAADEPGTPVNAAVEAIPERAA